MYYVGVDIGGTFIKAGLVDRKGKIVKQSSIETKATRKAELVVADIADTGPYRRSRICRRRHRLPRQYIQRYGHCGIQQ